MSLPICAVSQVRMHVVHHNLGWVIAVLDYREQPKQSALERTSTGPRPVIMAIQRITRH